MIRIGLSGTNWTRKSTTIQRLVKHLAPRPVEEIALNEFVQRCPYPLGPQQTLEGSAWMLRQVGAVLDGARPAGTIQVFDRTPLDILAFTLYAADRGHECDSPAVADLLSTIQHLAARFHRVFLCRPGDDWPSPATPARDALEFALLMDRYLTQAQEGWPGKLATLPWSANLRLKEMRNSLQGVDDQSRDLAI